MTDVAVAAPLLVTGDTPTTVRPERIPAHAFHRHDGAVTSDRTREHGSSVEVASAGRTAWTSYSRLDVEGVTGVTLVAARRALPAWGPTSVRLDVRPSGGGDADWRAFTAEVEVPDGGRYDWQDLALPVLDAPGLDRRDVDLRLQLTGAARVAEIRLTR
ncbi:hypothetical protein [Serinibacter arcticus]|uniref:hypothetical protein n=1 Tax=Serinibacter arcticus TaxID=1655435 RepID=UPI001F333FBC|nr:hypothetical protein [Serinibacter arcticus]